MKYSILIPVYNVEKYLRDCLNSVIAQTFNDFEVICVDDGSTDSSGKICDEYKTLYPGIFTVIHKDNEGQFSARRIGIQNAHGDYYCFLDSDDFIVPNFLETLDKELQESFADMVIFGYTRVDVVGKVVEETPPPLVKGKYSLQEMDQIRDIVVLSDKLNNLCFKCIKSELFDRDNDYSKYYAIRNGEDLVQSLPLFDKATSISVINDCLYLYRSNPKSMANSKVNIQTIDSWLAMYTILCEYAERWGYSESVYHQRFGLILRSIFSSLIANRYGENAYTKIDINHLIDRLLTDDFQTSLEIYKPRIKLSREQIIKCILITKSRMFVMISLNILGYCYSPLIKWRRRRNF